MTDIPCESVYDPATRTLHTVTGMEYGSSSKEQMNSLLYIIGDGARKEDDRREEEGEKRVRGEEGKRRERNRVGARV